MWHTPSATIAAHYDRHRPQSIIIISYSILSGLQQELEGGSYNWTHDRNESSISASAEICSTNRAWRQKGKGKDT